MQHTPVFLAALADVWNSSKKSNQEGETEKTPNLDKQAKKEKKWLSSVNQKTVPFIKDEQKGLVDIVLAIKVSDYRCYAEEVQNILKLQYCRHFCGDVKLRITGNINNFNLLESKAFFGRIC